MLEVQGLSAAYGAHPALNDVSLRVGKGEIVVILGANGAGKSTLLRAIAGVCEGTVEGSVTLDGAGLTGLPSDRIVEKGVAFVPEGRGIFGDLTVGENLLLGAYSARARAREAENLERVLKLFPKLADRKEQVARTMSGGEQQMVAVGRAMMSNPQILMLDEPSLGLSPLLCKELFQNLRAVKALGIGILMVEQNARQSLAIADRGYLLENARVTHEAAASALMNDPAVQAAYLGAGGQASGPAKARAPEPVSPAEAPPASRLDFAATPQPRRTADQQIGLSIDDLVQSAARASAAPRKPVVSQGEVSAAVGARVETVLKDIEQAAQAARRRPKRPPRQAFLPEPPPAPVPSPSSQDAAHNGAPPVIEIYRRPRVEVYRRGTRGVFERE